MKCNSAKYLYICLSMIVVINPAISQNINNVVPPPATSYGSWHPEKFRNQDRLLIMTEEDIEEIRSRIFEGNNIFSRIYSNQYNNRDGVNIGGIYQNAFRSSYGSRMDRAVLAKNRAFVALLGIAATPTGVLYEMSEEQINAMRDRALSLLRDFNFSAWSGGRGVVASQYSKIWDLQYRSRELICYLEAYDMLREIGGSRVWEEDIAQRLIQFASNIYYLANYWGGFFTYNNHRIITASALGMAGILFGDWGVDEDEFNDDGFRSYMPTAWVGYGMVNINSVLYTHQVYDDGGYNEGPHYLRYAFVHALPFYKAMKKFGEIFHLPQGGPPYGDWIESYSAYPDKNYMIRSPWYGRRYTAKPDLWDILDWITKIRQPEGRVPGIAHTFNDTYFPETSIAGGHNFWPQISYESDMGDEEMLNWALSAYTDSRIDFIAAGNTFQESPQNWETNQIFPQTGDIVFRSGWGLDDIYMHIYARNYAYDSGDSHVYSHIQHDNSSFLLGFKGHTLALDAGYISWDDKNEVNNPYNHNLILVQGLGPSRTSTTANIEDLQFGESYDYVRIRTDYRGSMIRRNFLFSDNRYFIIKDLIERSDRRVHQFLLHGNDTSPIEEPDGVSWQKEDAILKAFVTTDGGHSELTRSFGDYIHDNGYGMDRTETHKRLSEGRLAEDMQFLSVLFPYDANLTGGPEIVDVVGDSYAALFVDRTADVALGNRFEFILSQRNSSSSVIIPESQYGQNNRIINTISTDADLLSLSFDPADMEDPNKIKFFFKGMSSLNYGPYVLFPQYAPYLNVISDIIMNEMDTLEVTISASDVNGHYLSLSAINLPSFAQLVDSGNGKGIIRFTPGYLDDGAYPSIQIIVTDSGEPPLTDDKTFDLIVQNFNLSPNADAVSNIFEGSPPLSVSFSAEGSVDLDGTIQSYLWDFDDGTTASTSEISHNFNIAGKYYVILTVTDNQGAVGMDTIIIKNHPDLSQLFISEVSYADEEYGEFLEIYNNAPYDINMREFKLVQLHEKGYLKEIYDIGADEIWDESDMIIPSKHVFIIGRNTDVTTFADYWKLEPGTIHFNGADLIFGVPPSRWQLCYFDGNFNQQDGTIIDDTQSAVSGLNWRSFQNPIGFWNDTDYEEATPGYLDDDQSLPVELVSFITELNSNSIIVKWETKSEIDNMGFRILKSVVRESLYTQIASFQDNKDLRGEGNNSSGKTYEYLDENVIRNVTYWYKIVNVDYSGEETYYGPVSGTLSSINDHLFLVDDMIVPDQYKLYNNSPNPFNSGTSIKFDIPDNRFNQNHITIQVFDVSGKKVTELFHGLLNPGRYQIKWNGKNDADMDMASGLYILSLRSISYSSSKKMILLR